MLGLLCTQALAVAPTPHPQYTNVLVSAPTTPPPHNGSSPLSWDWWEQSTGRSRHDSWLGGMADTSIATCVASNDTSSPANTLIRTLHVSWSTKGRPPQEAQSITREMVDECDVFSSAPVRSARPRHGPGGVPLRPPPAPLAPQRTASECVGHNGWAPLQPSDVPFVGAAPCMHPPVFRSSSCVRYYASKASGQLCGKTNTAAYVYEVGSPPRGPGPMPQPSALWRGRPFK